MFIERKQLVRIIAQEVRSRIRELAEASDDEGDGKKLPKKPRTADAEDSPSPKGNVPTGPRADSNIESEPAEDDDTSDDEGIDSAGNAGEEPSGAVNNEVSGKTVQAVTIEPQSKILPGAKEVIISFTESTDALRVIVTATGQVKFFWRNSLHDIP